MIDLERHQDRRLVVLLGNPGRDYAQTRHNLGWWVGDVIAERHGIEFRPGEGRFLLAEARVAGCHVHLLKPTTFMNRSGQALDEYRSLYNLDPRNLVVVADDFALPLGRIRIRERGSSGGHNGLASIIEHVGTEEIARIRCGVGPLPEGLDPAEFVLDPFGSDELIDAQVMARAAADALAMVLTDGVTAAANVFNRKPPAPEGDPDNSPGAEGPGEGK